MKRQCVKCGAEYAIGQLSFDSGFCPKCKPSFLSLPQWFEPSPAGTRSVWLFLVAVHVLYLPFLSLLLDGGVISIPGSLYGVLVLLYFAVRFAVAKLRGWPILTRAQAIALLLLPGYGLAIFIALFHLAQRIRYGAW